MSSVTLRSSLIQLLLFRVQRCVIWLVYIFNDTLLRYCIKIENYESYNIVSLKLQ